METGQNLSHNGMGRDAVHFDMSARRRQGWRGMLWAELWAEWMAGHRLVLGVLSRTDEAGLRILRSMPIMDLFRCPAPDRRRLRA